MWIWDAVTGNPVGAPLVSYDSWVRAVAIGRAGNRDIIVSGSNDKTVRIWDAVNGQPGRRPAGGLRQLGARGGHRPGREPGHHRLRLRR